MQGPLGFDQNEHVTSHGVFLQNELSVSERVQLSFGVRFDEVEFEITDRYFADGRDDSGSKQFDDTSPMVGLVVELTDDLNFYTTYSSAFETPTTTEFNRPDGSAASTRRSSRRSATQLRGRAARRDRRRATLRGRRVHDRRRGRARSAARFRPRPAAISFENAGETSREGVEFSWIANPTDRIETTVSYTYSDFKFDAIRRNESRAVSIDRSGNVIPGTAENLLFAEFAYRAPRGWFAAADALYVDEQFGDNANTVVIDDYTLTNLRFGYDARARQQRLQSVAVRRRQQLDRRRPTRRTSASTPRPPGTSSRARAATATPASRSIGSSARRRCERRRTTPRRPSRATLRRGVYYDRLSRWTALARERSATAAGAAR